MIPFPPPLAERVGRRPPAEGVAHLDGPVQPLQPLLRVPDFSVRNHVPPVHLFRYQSSTVRARMESGCPSAGRSVVSGSQCSGSSPPAASTSVAETANIVSGPLPPPRFGGRTAASAARTGRDAACSHRQVSPSAVRTRCRTERLARTSGASPCPAALPEHLPETALAVAYGDHPRVRAGRRQPAGAVQAVQPAPAAVLRVVPETGVHGEQAQRPALRRHRQPGVGEDAGAALSAAAELRQTLRGLQDRVIERRGVLYGEDQGLPAAAVGGRLVAPLQDGLHGGVSQYS